MGYVVELYEALASAPDERARARLIAEAFESLEERYPNLPNLVTHQQVSETELRIRKEIEQLRSDLRATELRLQKEIEQLRGEVKTEIEQLRGDLRATELRLQKEIEQLRGEVKTEIEQLRGEVRTAIERSRNSLLMWLIPLMFAQVGAIAALVKLL